MFFRAASALSFSYSSDGILIFSARSFTVPPPYYNYTTIYVACQEVFWKTSLNFPGGSAIIDLASFGWWCRVSLVSWWRERNPFYLPSSSSIFSLTHCVFVCPLDFNLSSRAVSFSFETETLSWPMDFRRLRKYSARLSGAKCSPPCSSYIIRG